MELAVLDYFLSEGWDGYFTEYFDYDETLIFMMCWPDHEKIGSVTYLDIPNVHHLFYRANDGFIRDEKKVNFSRADLLDKAKTFQKNDIPRILALWAAKPRFKKPFIGREFLKYRHASELSASSLISYYDAAGGKDFFLDYLERRFPPHLQELFSSARNLTERVRKRKDLGPMPNLMDSCMSFWNITNAARYPFGKYMTPAAIKRFSTNTLKREPNFLAEEVVSLANEIIEARNAHLSIYTPPKAILDLRLWRDGRTANVEVKTPNDRLRPNQIEQLEMDSKDGLMSWVVEVHEHQVDKSIIEMKAKTKKKRQKLSSLATLSDELKNLGAWEEITKNAVYNLTLGKDVSNWEQLFAFLSDFPHVIEFLSEFRDQQSNLK